MLTYRLYRRRSQEHITPIQRIPETTAATFQQRRQGERPRAWRSCASRSLASGPLTSLATAVASATCLTSRSHPANVIPVSILFLPAPDGESGSGDPGSAPEGESQQPPRSEPPASHEAAGGCAWLAAWVATGMFAAGAALLAAVVVTGQGGPYGVTALLALWICVFGVVTLGAAAAMWAVHRLRDRSHSRRQTAAALTALAVAVAFLAPVVADLLGWLALPVEGWPVAVTGVTLLVLAAVVAAERSERRPALAFAALWVLLLGTISYRAWTDLRVEVVWLGPSVVGPTPGQVGFTATRSGDFEVRFGARYCWDGRVIATGRYEWQPGDPASSFGATMWVDLPSDVLPLHHGDLVRVCVRDGLAAGTRAGESVDPPSFWPRD
jgi:hypothetical protein